MLGTPGKLPEKKLLRLLLQAVVRAAEVLSPRQYGFRTSYFTIKVKSRFSFFLPAGYPIRENVILADYPNDRFLTYETDEGTRSRELAAGAAQGSTLRPASWNIF